MVKLLICDWNRTLCRDYYEEGYFGGICWRVFFSSVIDADVPRFLSLMRLGIKCYRLFWRAMWHHDRALEYVEQIMELVNEEVISGLPVGFVEEFTSRYALRMACKLDRRVLEPLREARERFGLRMGVISSGSRRGIERALAAAACGMDFVLANDFRVEGDTVAGLELRIMHNKADVLEDLLRREGLDPRDVMYVGDSRQDEECFQRVGWPVVSFLARKKDKRLFARRCGAFVPADAEDFRRHLSQACSPVAVVSCQL